MKKTQALLELAIFGALFLFLLGVLIQYGIKLNAQQEFIMKGFRRAVKKASEPDVGMNFLHYSEAAIKDIGVPDATSPYGVPRLSSVSSVSGAQRTFFATTREAVSYGAMAKQYFRINDKVYRYSLEGYKTSRSFVEDSYGSMIIIRTILDVPHPDDMLGPDIDGDGDNDSDGVYWSWVKIRYPSLRVKSDTENTRTEEIIEDIWDKQGTYMNQWLSKDIMTDLETILKPNCHTDNDGDTTCYKSCTYRSDQGDGYRKYVAKCALAKATEGADASDPAAARQHVKNYLRSIIKEYCSADEDCNNVQKRLNYFNNIIVPKINNFFNTWDDRKPSIFNLGIDIENPLNAGAGIEVSKGDLLKKVRDTSIISSGTQLHSSCLNGIDTPYKIFVMEFHDNGRWVRIEGEDGVMTRKYVYDEKVHVRSAAWGEINMEEVYEADEGEPTLRPRSKQGLQPGEKRETNIKTLKLITEKQEDGTFSTKTEVDYQDTITRYIKLNSEETVEIESKRVIKDGRYEWQVDSE